MLNQVTRFRNIILLILFLIAGLILLIVSTPHKLVNQAVKLNSSKLNMLYPINDKDLIDQEQEPDNTIDEAFPLQPGHLIMANLSSSGDEDFYRINVSSPTNLIITLTNLPKKYELKVLDPNLQVIGESTREGFINTVSEIKTTKQGRYYIEITPQYENFNQSIPYSIEVDSVPLK